MKTIQVIMLGAMIVLLIVDITLTQRAINANRRLIAKLEGWRNELREKARRDE